MLPIPYATTGIPRVVEGNDATCNILLYAVGICLPASDSLLIIVCRPANNGTAVNADDIPAINLNIIYGLVKEFIVVDSPKAIERKNCC